MANIYRDGRQPLHELLAKAGNGDGATLLIPDLQRPYVWSPIQVILLIDSLIRGWPFGTLLLWRVSDQEAQEGIPSRSFWHIVDRTEEASGSQLPRMNPPAEYHMILDGQQRIQSLLIALGSDDSGFKLEDKDWLEVTREKRLRGKQTKFKHWTKASLCFDLDKFLEAYEREKSLLKIDFREVLTWAITDPEKGQSTFQKVDKYEEPLEKAYDNQQRFIRLGRLWNQTAPNASLKESHFRGVLRTELAKHGVAKDKIEKLVEPLAEIMTTLRDVKLSDVNYLELQPFTDDVWTKDAYNDSIVNIFTRLNTAGRTLTREEITLAWLKVGWKSEETEGKLAGDCFEALRQNLSENDLNVEIDDLVASTSLIWSIFSNQGKLLTNADLLKGNVIRPMASSLSLQWKPIETAFKHCAYVLDERGLKFGTRGHFSSLYELSLLCGWIYLMERWKSANKLSELHRDALDKLIKSSVTKLIDRWIFCSQWAGRWSDSSAEKNVEPYTKKLCEVLEKLDKTDNFKSAHSLWEAVFTELVSEQEGGALDYVGGILAVRRERVSVYYNLLWVWHRLDSERWKMSEIQLRIGKSEPRHEVDHTVSYSLWEEKLSSGLPTGVADLETAKAISNRLGNCSLLEKNFNISKKNQELNGFLEKIHEFETGGVSIQSWCEALQISNSMLKPLNSTLEDIVSSIDQRDLAMRDELKKFVRGEKSRTDI